MTTTQYMDELDPSSKILTKNATVKLYSDAIIKNNTDFPISKGSMSLIIDTDVKKMILGSARRQDRG